MDEKNGGFISIKDHREIIKSLLTVGALIIGAWAVTTIYAFRTIGNMTDLYFTTDYEYGTEITNTNTNTNSNDEIREE